VRAYVLAPGRAGEHAGGDVRRCGVFAEATSIICSGASWEAWGKFLLPV
jgi:hypothetical protein